MAKFNEHEAVAKKYNIGGSSLFWRPEKGENKVRILSEYEAYSSHFVNADKKSYMCLKDDIACTFCEQDIKSGVKFLLWILDRKSGEVKLAQLGYSIIKQIGELSCSEDWKFENIPDYDITIKKTGQGLETEYFVQPTPNKEPLTEEEKNEAHDKMKDLREIINGMKKKTVSQLGERSEPSEPVISDEIKLEDIPF